LAVSAIEWPASRQEPQPMILSTRAGSVRQNVHSGVPWTAMLANYQGAIRRLGARSP
jgi:hypothetical protein